MALPEEGLDEETFVPGPHEPATAVNTLARAFVLDANSEWITVATGNATSELSEDGRSLTLSLHEEHDANMVLFSTTFHKEQDILRQQGTSLSPLRPSTMRSDGYHVDLGRWLGRCAKL